MKKTIFAAGCSLILLAGVSFAQDIAPYKIPGAVTARFQQDFPDAKEVDWERKNGNYEVEFELGWRSLDHEIDYDSAGTVLKDKAEISKRELPSKVSDKLDADFRWYWIKDVKRIAEGGDTTYLMEAKSLFREWELALNSNGTLLSKFGD